MGADIEITMPDPGDDPGAKGYNPAELRNPSPANPYGNTYNQKVHEAALRRKAEKESQRNAAKAAQEAARALRESQREAAKDGRNEYRNQLRERMRVFREAQREEQRNFQKYRKEQKRELNNTALSLAGLDWRLGLGYRLLEEPKMEARIAAKEKALEDQAAYSKHTTDFMRRAMRFKFGNHEEFFETRYINPLTKQWEEIRVRNKNFMGPPRPPKPVAGDPDFIGPVYPQSKQSSSFVGPMRPQPGDGNFIGPPRPPGPPPGSQQQPAPQPPQGGFNVAGLAAAIPKFAPYVMLIQGIGNLLGAVGGKIDKGIGGTIDTGTKLLSSAFEGDNWRDQYTSFQKSTIAAGEAVLPSGMKWLMSPIKAQVALLESIDKTLISIGKRSGAFAPDFMREKITSDIAQLRRDMAKGMILDRPMAQWERQKRGYQERFDAIQTQFFSGNTFQVMMASLDFSIRTVSVTIQALITFLDNSPSMQMLGYLAKIYNYLMRINPPAQPPNAVLQQLSEFFQAAPNNFRRGNVIRPSRVLP